ncbi:MAG: hypothetical protein ACRD96_14030 [Bryobacteraceae bacterium]
MKGTIMRILAAVVVLISAATAQSLDPTVLRLLPADTGMLAGIEWRRLMQSPMMAAMEKDMHAAGMANNPLFAAIYKAIANDVDAVVLAIPTAGLKPGAKNPPVLGIVKGRFDAGQIRSFTQQMRSFTQAKGTSEVYKNIELLGWGTETDVHLALLDATTLVFGERPQVVAAIDRHAGARGAASSPRIARAQALAARNDVWFVADVPEGAFKDIPAGPHQVMSSILGLDVGMSFATGGLDFLASLRTKDEESARSLQQMVQGLVAMASMSQEQPDAAAILRKVQVAAEPLGLRVSLSLDRAELERRMQTMLASMRQPATAPDPEPAGPKTIRITGLDGGPIEIPVKK